MPKTNYYIGDKIEMDGHTIEILHDTEPENPREWSNIWTILTVPNHRHRPIDDTLNNPDPRVFDAEMVVSVFRYEHGMVRFYASDTGPDPADRWDTCQVGFAILPKGTLQREYLAFGQTKEEARKNARAALDGELATYTSWCNGTVYGYQATGPDGEQVGCCYGFFPDTEDGPAPAHMIEQAREDVAYSVRERQKEADEVAYWSARDVVTTSQERNQ